MAIDAHKVTAQFEEELSKYTGAKYAVATNSCTMALELSLIWQAWLGNKGEVTIPRFTYVSLPQVIERAGFTPKYENLEWKGMYQLKPYPVWDSARRLTSKMYMRGQFICLSFHVAKILGDTQGGAILHDDPEADAFLRRARFDGRTAKVPLVEDTFPIPSYFVRHCYLSPDVSARLLNRMQYLPEHNEDLPNDPYPDLEAI